MDGTSFLYFRKILNKLALVDSNTEGITGGLRN